MNTPAGEWVGLPTMYPKVKISRPRSSTRASTFGLLWVAIAAAMCQAWPANAQERPKETGGPMPRSAQTGATGANESARPADTMPAKPSATPGGPMPRSPQTGATGANEFARPADTIPAKPSARPTGPDVVTLNFVNADIEGVVKVVSEITGRNFLLDPRVKGTISIVSAKPMSRGLVYEVFLSALRLQGFAAVEGGGIVKIIPEADAKLHSSPTYGQSDQARVGGDRIETRVFTLKYESATQMLPVLRPLIAPNNAITAYQNSNTLVITDYANNLQRLEKIIDSIDQPSGSDPVSIPLQYVSAVDTAVTVSSPVRGGGRGASDQTRCQPHSLRVCQGQRRRCH